MSELVAEMEEDWSLQAIVRGSSGDFGKMEMDGLDSFHQHQFDQDFTSFQDILEGSACSSDELEELYKPFYKAATSFCLPGQSAVVADQDKLQPHDQSPSVTSPVAAVYTPKYKKRKNQQKRVVMQVSAKDVSSDMWAWRKYGQKPIKGSPYPRSYYRCSSSKGCLARKQVEQSCTDPSMFIITYSAEHSHSQPTRRNSLAGTVRQKFPSPKNPKPHKPDSPKIETEAPAARIIKEEDQETKEGSENIMMSEFVFNEDFFSGLEEFDEFVSHDHFPATARSCSWV